MSSLPPGVDVDFAPPTPAGALARRLSTPFVVGETEKGPQTAQSIRSLGEFTTKLGKRNSVSQAAYDWVDAHFKDGGMPLWFSRRLGAAAALAAGVANNAGATVALNFKAKSKGAWGNRIKRQIVAGSVSGFVVVILFDAEDGAGFVEVERTLDLATAADAAAWSSTTSKYVDITAGGGGGVPAVAAATALSGGTDDIGGIVPADTTLALDKFPIELGTGDYVLPSTTDVATQLLAARHAKDRQRMLKAEAIPSSSATAIAAQCAALTAGGDGDSIDFIVSRVTHPGITSAGSRTNVGSFVRTAAQARNDRAGVSPNQPAAGKFGTSGYATGVTVEWSDAERALLNSVGANVLRVINGQVVVYGSRTLADPVADPAGVRLGSARMRMAFAEIARIEGERVVFVELDEEELGALEANIAAGIKEFQRSLYALDVSTQLVDGEDAGTYVLLTSIEFQVREDAERVQFTVNRTIRQES